MQWALIIIAIIEGGSMYGSVSVDSVLMQSEELCLAAAEKIAPRETGLFERPLERWPLVYCVQVSETGKQ
ncbi:MAG: hypothetical protein V3W19_08040 [Desulfatiglandales bacterium]